MQDATVVRNGLTMRYGVGLLLVNERNDVLAGQRIHVTPVEWQFPQGGRGIKEDPNAAGRRELREELGVMPDDVALLGALQNQTEYVLPEKFRGKRGFDGQIHDWLIYRYLKAGLPNLAMASDKEFSQVRWVRPRWVPDHAADWRQDIYRQVTASLETVLRTHI